VILLLAWLPSAWGAEATILVVESYHAEYRWDQAYRRALTESLAPKYTLEFFEMDTKRQPASRHAQMAEKALARIQALHPALVVLGDDAALQYLGPRLDTMDIPGVYLGINGNPRKYGAMRFEHITGVLERPLIKRNISFIQQVAPSTHKVQLLFDNGLTSRVIYDEMFDGKSSMWIDGIQVDLQLCQTLDEWKQAVLQADARGYQVTIAGLYHTLKRANGRVADADETMVWSSANTPVPLFALWDFAVGPDMAVGGLVLSGWEQGHAAAAIALDILERQVKPSSLIPVTARQGDFLFSKKQLKRFHLSLPPDIARQAHLMK